MALVDEVDAPPRAKTGTSCSMGDLLESLPAAEREALQRMLDDPHWTDPATYAACERNGYHVKLGKQTVGRHRRRDCRCFR